MTALEKEQWADLSWACDVMAGRGDQHDNLASAHNMLQSISVSGVIPTSTARRQLTAINLSKEI